MTNEILKGAQEGLDYLRGDKTKGRAHKVRSRDVDVRAIRKKLGMTQSAFSEAFGIPVPTLKKWEGRDRVPEGPAKAYLLVIEKNPTMVQSSLHSVA